MRPVCTAVKSVVIWPRLAGADAAESERGRRIEDRSDRGKVPALSPLQAWCGSSAPAGVAWNATSFAPVVAMNVTLLRAAERCASLAISCRIWACTAWTVWSAAVSVAALAVCGAAVSKVVIWC